MIWEIDDKSVTIEGLDADGNADPAYAAALGLIRAPFGRRALAYVCDLAVWLLLQIPLCLGALPLLLMLIDGRLSLYGLVNHPGFVLAVLTAAVSVVLSIALVIVQVVLHARRGVTIGKAIAGIRTVNVKTLERPKFWPIVLRFLIVAGAGIVPVAGSVVMLSSPLLDGQRRGRGWHDKAANVWLVDVRKGLQPFDEKRLRVARKMVTAEPAPVRAPLPSLSTPHDPATQPEYRPAHRTSAGLLGHARPHEAGQRPVRDLRSTPDSTPAPPAPTKLGEPVLGGYRQASDEPESDEASALPAFAMPDAAQPWPGTALEASPQDPAPQWAVPPAAAGSAPATPPVVGVPPDAPFVPAQGFTPSAPPQPTAPPPNAALQPPPSYSDYSDAPAETMAAKPTAARIPTHAVETPREPPTRASAREAARTALQLVFDTGDTVALTGPVLIGRNPDSATHVDARLVKLPDSTRSLSKTHLYARPVDGGLEITDCHSTNGSAVVRDGVEHDLTPDTPVRVAEGEQIRLGDRFAVIARHDQDGPHA